MVRPGGRRCAAGHLQGTPAPAIAEQLSFDDWLPEWLGDPGDVQEGLAPETGTSQRLPGEPLEEFLQRAGVLFDVELLPMAALDPYADPIQAEGWRGVIRTDTRAVLGVVGSMWTPLPNSEMARMLAQWEELDIEGGHPQVVEGRFFLGGRICAYTVRLPMPRHEVAGQSIEANITIVNGFDGRRSRQTLLTCTLAGYPDVIGVGGDTDGTSWVRHTKTVRTRAEQADQDAQAAALAYHHFCEMAAELHDRESPLQDLRRAFSTWTKQEDNDDAWSEYVGILNSDERIPDAARKTAWGAFLAGVYWTKNAYPMHKGQDDLVRSEILGTLARKRQAWAHLLRAGADRRRAGG